MPRNMIGRWPMAALAENAQRQAGFVVLIGQGIRGTRFDRGGVAFQATRSDRSGEVHRTVLEARTIDPLRAIRPVAHGQLKQSVAMPVEIALPSRTRSD